MLDYPAAVENNIAVEFVMFDRQKAVITSDIAQLNLKSWLELSKVTTAK